MTTERHSAEVPTHAPEDKTRRGPHVKEPAAPQSAAGGELSDAPTTPMREDRSATSYEKERDALHLFEQRFSDRLATMDATARSELLTELLFIYHRVQARFEKTPEKGINVDFQAMLNPLRQPPSLHYLIQEYAPMGPERFEFTFARPLSLTLDALHRLIKNPNDHEALTMLPTVGDFRLVVQDLLQREGQSASSSGDKPTQAQKPRST